MSAVEIYQILPDGDVRHWADERNPHACAWHIWDTLAKRYFFGQGFYVVEDQLWRLFGTDRIAPRDALVLGFTFDRVWVAQAHLPPLAAALTSFWAEHPEAERRRVADTIPRVVTQLDALARADVRGACFNQTSVNSNPWTVRVAEDEHRPFNFDRDTVVGSPPRPPWELFDADVWAREAAT